MAGRLPQRLLARRLRQKTPDRDHRHGISAVDQDNPNGLTILYGRTITFNRETAFGER